MQSELVDENPGAPPVDVLRRQIERMIVTGDFAPGDRLNELDMAMRLEVSRSSLREALRLLEQAGLVRIIPNKGAVVRKVTFEEMLDLFDVRAGFARTAGRLLATRVSFEQIDTLNELHAKMHIEASKKNVQLYYGLNLDFHLKLMHYTSNESLVQLDELVRNQLQLPLRRAAYGAAQLRTSNAEHRKIIDAIAAGNPEKAGQAFERHILSGKARMLETWSSGGGLGGPSGF